MKFKTWFGRVKRPPSNLPIRFESQSDLFLGPCKAIQKLCLAPIIRLETTVACSSGSWMTGGVLTAHGVLVLDGEGGRVLWWEGEDTGEADSLPPDLARLLNLKPAG